MKKHFNLKSREVRLGKSKVIGLSFSFSPDGWWTSFYKDGGAHFDHHMVLMNCSTTKTKNGVTGKSLLFISLWFRLQFSIIDL
jgi:hypothetical protein